MSTSSPNQGNGSPAGWEAEITALEKEGCRAMVARDIASLERLWSDEFLVNSPLNQVLSKEQVLGLVRAGRIRHSSYEQYIESLVRHDDAVIVMGRETVVDPPENRSLNRRFTNIWRKEGEVWRLLARHANIIAALPR